MFKKVLFSFLNNRATKIGLFHFYLTVYKNNSLKFSNYSKFNNDKSKIKAICYLLVEVNYIFYIYEVFVLNTYDFIKKYTYHTSVYLL